jgi:monoamine oxidase
LIEVYTGGAFARQLEAEGTEAAAAFFMEQLGGLFGRDVASRLRLIAATAWAADPFARGSYSYARPGHADDRAVLAAPVNNQLFFAGEACSKAWFSTAHGAYVTGLAAAAAALKSLGRGVVEGKPGVAHSTG